MPGGSEAYMASVMKLCGNFFIVLFIDTIAQGMTLAEKNGVSREHRTQLCDLQVLEKNTQTRFCTSVEFCLGQSKSRKSRLTASDTLYVKNCRPH